MAISATALWINALGQTNRTQSLTWDAFDRLIAVTQRDTASNGFNWTACYDSLGRRIETTCYMVLTNVAVQGPSATDSTNDSWYDPQVEFEEVGVQVNGVGYWKTLGPDANGTYGGMQGVGGVESILQDYHITPVGILQDYFGNVLATIANSSVAWNSNRFSSYGPVPGYQSLALSPEISLAQSLGWRGKRIDETGLICLGARHYDSTAGRFLSADPSGHSASMDLYSFCEGDPVNRFDPDGRLGKGFYDSLTQTAQGFNNLVKNAYNSIDYPIASLFYGSDKANQWYGQNVQGLQNTVTGTARTAYDVSAFASYALVSPFDNDAAYQAYGNSMDRLGTLGTAATGGANNSTPYRVGFTALNAATLLFGAEAGEAGNVRNMNAAEGDSEVERQRHIYRCGWA